MSEPASGMATVTDVPRWRRCLTLAFWRGLFTSGLTPRAIGCAFGVGAAVGVAPLPGLQMATVALLCWRLNLNFPLALLASNISLGPLLVMWFAIAASLGRWMRLGVVPWESYASFIADVHAAPSGWPGVMQVAGHCLADWLLGSLLLVPMVGLLFGLAGFAIARGVHAARLRRDGASREDAPA